MTNNDPFLTVPEVAEVLRLSIYHTRELIRSGELEAHKFGHRTVRVKQSVLDAYVDGSAIKCNTPNS
jgi:excisionase family DNA binding protein